MLVEQGEQQSVLAVETVARGLQGDDLVEVAVGLETKLEHNIGFTSELGLNVVVLLEERSEHVALVSLETTGVGLEELVEGSNGDLHLAADSSVDAVAQEVLGELAQTSSGEFDVLRVAHLDRVADHILESGGDNGRPSWTGSEKPDRRAARVAKGLDELLDDGLHAEALVVTVKDVVDDLDKVAVSLVGLAADDDRQAEVGQLAGKGLACCTRLGSSSERIPMMSPGLRATPAVLDERDDTILGGNERQVHLHDLDLGNGLTSLDVVTRLDKEADELTGRGRTN